MAIDDDVIGTDRNALTNECVTPHFFCCQKRKDEWVALRAENERLNLWAIDCDTRMKRADAHIEEQRQLLNTAVVKLDSCYQDYKKYRNQAEAGDARIRKLKAALIEICNLSSDYHNLSEIYDEATAALRGEDSTKGAANGPSE